MDGPLEDVMNARLYLGGTGNDRYRRGRQPGPSRQYLGSETLRHQSRRGPGVDLCRFTAKENVPMRCAEERKIPAVYVQYVRGAPTPLLRLGPHFIRTISRRAPAVSRLVESQAGKSKQGEH